MLNNSTSAYSKISFYSQNKSSNTKKSTFFMPKTGLFRLRSGHFYDRKPIVFHPKVAE